MLANAAVKYSAGALDFFHEGICSGHVAIHYHGYYVSIWDVEILKPLRGKGIGHVLMQEVMDYIAQNYPDISSAHLFVEIGNERVMKLYEEFGFKHVRAEAYVDRYKMEIRFKTKEN